MLLSFDTFIVVPVLAAPFQGLVAAVLMIIAFIGWIVNLINSQNHPPPPARRRRPNSDRSRSVQDEIDQFLNEARQSRKEQRRRNAPSEVRANDGIEVIGPGQARRPPGQPKKSREDIWREQTGTARRRPPQPSAPAAPQPQRPPTLASTAVEAERLGEALASRHATPLTAANEVAAHVQQRMAARLSAQVERNLPHAMDAAVAADLGAFRAEAPTAPGQLGYFETKRRDSEALVRLRTLLSQREGLKNAMIVNEILSPPISRRRRSAGSAAPLSGEIAGRLP